MIHPSFNDLQEQKRGGGHNDPQKDVSLMLICPDQEMIKT